MKIKKSLPKLKGVLSENHENENLENSDDELQIFIQQRKTLPFYRVINLLMHKVYQMAFPIDVFSLCDLSASLLQTQITVIADRTLPSRAPGLLMRRRNGNFLIVYRPSQIAVSEAISILHELAHILLFHWHQLPKEVFWDRSFYTDRQEQEAERFAHLVMSYIVDKPQSRISARFENLIPKERNDCGVQDADPRPARRFSALMP